MTVTVSDGDTDRKETFYVSVLEPQGVGIPETNGEFGFNIFPNPVKNSLFIESQELIKRIEIIGLTGQVLVAESIPEILKFELDTRFLATGIYFLKLTNSSGDRSFRAFVKQ